MLSEIIDQKPQFISGDSITLVNNQIKTIGQSYKFKNIKKLHLSYNMIQSLDGIEQFINLQHLSLTDNQIEQLKEIDKIPKTLQQLTVLNNPITANPNIDFLIMRILPNLTHLNGDKFNRQRIYQLNDLMIKWGDSLFSYLSYNINHNMLQTLEDKQESALNKLLKVLQIQCSQQPEIKLDYRELLEHVIRYLQQQFKNNQLKLYLTQAAIQQNDLDIERFAQDEQYYQQQLLKIYIKDAFPIYPANKQYLLALNDFLIFKQKSIDVTARQNEDRIKPFNQIQIIQKQKSQNKLLSDQIDDQKDQEINKEVQTNRIRQNIENQQIIEQEQYEQDQKRQIDYFKKQFKVNKGLELIKKLVIRYQLKLFLKQYPKYISMRKLSNLTKIRDFMNIMNKYQQKKCQFAIKQLKQNKVLCKFDKILTNLLFLNKGFNFFRLKAITQHINTKSIQQRNQYLLKNVFSILKPLRYQKKKVQILQLKLITFKFKGLQREALMLMRIYQKQTSLKRLNKTNNYRKRNPSFQNNYMESIAVEQFRRQRDILRDFNY